ncbi:hypothetical protein KR009_012044 [Drosophila setifemur]|nr:hypothetical protein KR009_012044 [Drosophila setifemur]
MESLESKDSDPIELSSPASSEEALVCKRRFDGEDDVCAFCLESIQEPEKLHCNHSFCKSCLEVYREARSWVANRCPICRSRLYAASKQYNDDWLLFVIIGLVLAMFSLGTFYLLILYW